MSESEIAIMIFVIVGNSLPKETNNSAKVGTILTERKITMTIATTINAAGYTSAPLTLPAKRTFFSIVVAILSNAVSNRPLVSPTSTMLRTNSSKTFGYSAIASDNG